MRYQIVNQKRLFVRGVIVPSPVIGFIFDMVPIRR